MSFFCNLKNVCFSLFLHIFCIFSNVILRKVMKIAKKKKIDIPGMCTSLCLSANWNFSLCKLMLVVLNCFN